MEDTVVSVPPTQAVRKKPKNNKKSRPPDLTCEANAASFCCAPLGIVAMILTLLANSAADRGELKFAYRCAGFAGIVIMIVWVFSLCGFIAALAFYMYTNT